MRQYFDDLQANFGFRSIKGKDRMLFESKDPKGFGLLEMVIDILSPGQKQTFLSSRSEGRRFFETEFFVLLNTPCYPASLDQQPRLFCKANNHLRKDRHWAG